MYLTPTADIGLSVAGGEHTRLKKDGDMLLQGATPAVLLGPDETVGMGRTVAGGVAVSAKDGSGAKKTVATFAHDGTNASLSLDGQAPQLLASKIIAQGSVCVGGSGTVGADKSAGNELVLFADDGAGGRKDVVTVSGTPSPSLQLPALGSLKIGAPVGVMLSENALVFGGAGVGEDGTQSTLRLTGTFLPSPTKNRVLTVTFNSPGTVLADVRLSVFARDSVNPNEFAGRTRTVVLAAVYDGSKTRMSHAAAHSVHRGLVASIPNYTLMDVFGPGNVVGLDVLSRVTSSNTPVCTFSAFVRISANVAGAGVTIQ